MPPSDVLGGPETPPHPDDPKSGWVNVETKYLAVLDVPFEKSQPSKRVKGRHGKELTLDSTVIEEIQDHEPNTYRLYIVDGFDEAAIFDKQFDRLIPADFELDHSDAWCLENDIRGSGLSILGFFPPTDREPKKLLDTLSSCRLGFGAHETPVVDGCVRDIPNLLIEI
ncbi:hypothetical protein BDV19DRAFT_393716 [Aspergillus venezuelensis]